MTSSWTSALVVVLLVATLAVPFGTTPAAASTQADCSNRVVYDAFRFDNATVDAAANGSATATAQNTEVRVEQATGFLRINATNPNGYCVEYRVNIAPSVVSPAELGDVDSNDGAYTAGWHAVRDLDRDEIYTQVVFTLPAGETASFAPSKLRVKSLAWTGTAKDTGGSWWESVSDYSFGEEEKLEKRTYRFSATNSTETITVSLRNESTGRTIEDWTAMYRTSNGSAWTPVSTDTEAPVFVRQVSDHRLQFVFNDPDAEVRFTAEPTRWDKVKHSWESWTAGASGIDEFLEGLFD